MVSLPIETPDADGFVRGPFVRSAFDVSCSVGFNYYDTLSNQTLFYFRWKTRDYEPPVLVDTYYRGHPVRHGLPDQTVELRFDEPVLVSSALSSVLLKQYGTNEVLPFIWGPMTLAQADTYQDKLYLQTSTLERGFPNATRYHGRRG